MTIDNSGNNSGGSSSGVCDIGGNDVNTSEPVIADIPRHQMKNPRNFTPIQLAKKDKELKEMQRVYPKTSPAWLEMVWDFVETKGEEAIKDIIDNKRFEVPPTKCRDVKGGVIKDAVSVERKTEEELQFTFSQ